MVEDEDKSESLVRTAISTLRLIFVMNEPGWL